MGKRISKAAGVHELEPVSLGEVIHSTSASRSRRPCSGVACTSSATLSAKRRSMRWLRSVTTSTASCTRPTPMQPAPPTSPSCARGPSLPGRGDESSGRRRRTPDVLRFPKAQWKTLRTTNVIERLHEEFRRRVKTQGSLPSEDAALVLLFSLVASGQIKLRRIDGWRKIASVLNQRQAVAA